MMMIIAKAGEGRSLVMRAIEKAKEGLFDEADECLKKSDEYLTEAHKLQCELMFDDARNGNAEFSILLIHTFDHVMGGITVRDLGEEIVWIYKKGGIK